MSDSANIARHLPLMAARQPDRPALKIPRGRRDGRIDYLTLSFRELDAEVDAWCARLAAAGVRRGDRTLVMVKPGLPLIASVFALFKLGAVPVVIDPGMGLRSFLRCVVRSRPRVLLGLPLAQVISRLFFRPFASIEVRITARSALTARLTRPAAEPGCSPMDYNRSVTGFAPAEVGARELAAILFTSGSTGAPKGVCYEHGMFEAQVRLIRAHYGIEPGEVDLPMLPIFALFNPALGMTTVVPEIDPRRPALVDPAKIVEAIRQEGVTNSFGSPTLWLKIQRHCLAHGDTLPTMKRVLCAGAPVPAELWENPVRWLPHGHLHSPYGATEALPVCSISDAEIEQRDRKQGSGDQGSAAPARLVERVILPPMDSAQPAPSLALDRLDSDPSATPAAACVGSPLPEMRVRIIAITEGPIATLAETTELPPGEIGEIIVSGPVVTRRYDALPSETSAAKIEQDGARLQGSGIKDQENAGAGSRQPASTRGSASSTPGLSAPGPLAPGTLAPAPAAPTPSASAAVGLGPLALAPLSPETSAAPRAAVWHRMGDCGYLDAAGRLWFCGRKVERVTTAQGTLFTEPCERVFRLHPQVERCALVGTGPAGRQEPALVVQPRKGGPIDENAIAHELRRLALAHPHTRAIRRFYFRPEFPVDVRHNAKIHRLRLARWTAHARAHIPQADA